LSFLSPADLDGEPDPHPDEALAAMGALDAWPRVYLEYQGDGFVALDPGERYLAEAIVDPLFLETEQLELGVPTPVTALELLFLPAALHQLSDGSEEEVQGLDLPSGSWAITVVQLTGQTWTVPNELADHDASSGDFDPFSQALGLEVE